MNVDQLFPSKYLKAEDFAEGEVKILTVRNVEEVELGQGASKETKGLMTFREKDVKPLVLNKTNTGIISKFYGKETDDWLGKKIALHVMEVEMKGDVVQAIRVKTKAPVAKPTPAPVEVDADLFEDDPAIDVGFRGTGVQVPSKQKQTA